MHIVLVTDQVLKKDGKTNLDLLISSLASTLRKRDFTVQIIAPKGSVDLDGIEVIYFESTNNLKELIDVNADVVHFLSPATYTVTELPNLTSVFQTGIRKDIPNLVVSSRSLQNELGTENYAGSGIDFSLLPALPFSEDKGYILYNHTLTKSNKALKYAIKLAKASGQSFKILGAKKWSITGGFRFTSADNIEFIPSPDEKQSQDLLTGASAQLIIGQNPDHLGTDLLTSLYQGIPVVTNLDGFPRQTIEACPEYGLFLNSASDRIELSNKQRGPELRKSMELYYDADSFMTEKYVMYYTMLSGGKNLDGTRISGRSKRK